jgi:hypothetical protein
MSSSTTPISRSAQSTDREVLQFIHDRLINVHGENENYDYMYALRRIIDSMNGHADIEDVWLAGYNEGRNIDQELDRDH